MILELKRLPEGDGPYKYHYGILDDEMRIKDEKHIMSFPRGNLYLVINYFMDRGWKILPFSPMDGYLYFHKKPE